MGKWESQGDTKVDEVLEDIKIYCCLKKVRYKLDKIDHQVCGKEKEECI